MHALGREPRRHRGHSRLLGRQHQLIERPLLAREATVDRERAGDVAVVVVSQRAAGVDQQQVAIAQGGVVGGVVQHAGVVAASHDRAVGRPPRALLQEVLLDHRLHLALIEAGPGHLAGQLVGLGRNASRFAHPLQLFGALAQAQAVQDRAGGHQPQGGMAAAGGAVELAGPGCQHQGLHRRVPAHPESDALGPPEIVAEALLQFLKRVGQIGAELGHGALGAPAEAGPHLGAGLLGGHKQHIALPRRPVWQEQGYGVGLIEAGEVPEVTVLAEGPLAVGVVHRQRCRRQHRCRPTQLLEKALPPPGVDGLGRDVRRWMVQQVGGKVKGSSLGQGSQGVREQVLCTLPPVALAVLRCVPAIWIDEPRMGYP